MSEQPTRESRLAEQWAKDWLDTQGRAPGINLGEMEQSLAKMLIRWGAMALEEAVEQLEHDLGPGIDAIGDQLPERAMRDAARIRLNLCKSNIRALAKKAVSK
jgi:hypothetical protein